MYKEEIYCTDLAAKMKRWHNVVLMMSKRLRRWHIIETTLNGHSVSLTLYISCRICGQIVIAYFEN